MFKGEVEVSWTALQDDEVLVCLRVPGAKLARLRQGERVLVAVESIARAKSPPGVRTRLAALAGRWCNDERFREWLAATFPTEYIASRRSHAWNSTKECDVEREIAAAVVRTTCEVKSRAEFDSDPHAGQRFHRLIRLPFRMWLDHRYPQTFAQEP
jgi:hypothetical protein